MKFSMGFIKVAAGTGFFQNSKKMDLAGLGLLAAAPAYHGYQGMKNIGSKDKKEKSEAKTNLALAGTELGGLGLLARAVQKGH